MRLKCRYCRAKVREEFFSEFRGVRLCHDCACEYAKIFHGYQNRKARRDIPNFEEFKAGWHNYEKENNLPEFPIPKTVQEYYERALHSNRSYEDIVQDIVDLCMEDRFGISEDS